MVSQLPSVPRHAFSSGVEASTTRQAGRARHPEAPRQEAGCSLGSAPTCVAQAFGTACAAFQLQEEVGAPCGNFAVLLRQRHGLSRHVSRG